jgi:hypothetical protein
MTPKAWARQRAKESKDASKYRDAPAAQRRAREIGTRVYYYVLHGGPTPFLKRYREMRTDLVHLGAELRELVREIRPITPNDRAWEYYDKDMEKFEYQLDRPQVNQVDYIATPLHQAAQAVEGAASRSRY